MANLRWSWHAESLDLLESVDPELWVSCERDPNRMLGEVSAERFAQLARDRKFLRRLEDVGEDLNDYLEQPRWYQKQQAAGADFPTSIGYFSPEFGITEVLPQYSGGLGILAGDHLKAASDLGVPIIGVGLLYGSGYFRQSLSRDGWQLETVSRHWILQRPADQGTRIRRRRRTGPGRRSPCPRVAHAARAGVGGAGRPGPAAAAGQ